MKNLLIILLSIIVVGSAFAQTGNNGKVPTGNVSKLMPSKALRDSKFPFQILATGSDSSVYYWDSSSFNKKFTKYFIDSLIKNYNDTVVFGTDCRDSLWRIGSSIFHRSTDCSIQSTILPSLIDTHIVNFKIINKDTIFEITRNDGLILRDTQRLSKLLPINGARLHLGGSAADTASIIGQIFPHDLFYWSIDTCRIHVLFREKFGGTEQWVDWGDIAIRGDCMPYLTHDIVGNGVSPIKVPNSNTLPGNKQWLTYTAAGGCLTVQAVNSNNEIEWKLDTNCIKGLIDTVNHLQEFNTTGTIGGSGIGKWKTTLSKSGGSLEVKVGDGVEVTQVTAGKDAVIEIKAVPATTPDTLNATVANSSTFTVKDGISQLSGFTINAGTNLSFSGGITGANGSVTLNCTPTVVTQQPIIGDGSISNPITLDACSAWWNSLRLANPSEQGTFLFIDQLGCLKRKACTCSVGMLQNTPSDNVVLVSNTGQPTMKDIMYKMALKIEELERRINELEKK